MERSITLRSASPEDQEFLFALYASTREEELNLWGWDDAQKKVFLDLQFRAKNQQYTMTFPEADDRIVLLNSHAVGRILVDRQGSDITFLDIALLPEYRNQNIGTTLIQSLIQEARDTQKCVVLHVVTTNAAARLYERLGFNTVKEDDVYREMKFTPAKTTEP
jgi:ribosomal protein S18 acetylase RimI-like enzyme